MKPTGMALAVASLFAFGISTALAHDDAAGPRGAKLGKVLFKTSCSAEAQKQFEVALARLHSFHFPETMNAFAAVPKIDSGCAIAYWGLAVSNRPNPLVGPWDKATLQRGLEFVQKGEAIGAKTQRERDWLAAIKVFYQDHETVDQNTRTANYEKAMERLAKKYPDDVEAKIFHALALNEVFDHKNMEPLLKAVRILEPLDKKYPEHPGITHYLIHSYDFAPIAQKGIPAANKYAKIAPAAPHALHMPSHIYSMVGMWKESIQANLKSNEESVRYSTEAKLDGVLAGVPHANDFMTYAHLQLGQDVRAKALIAESAKMTKVIGPVSAGQMARAAVPARYYLERQDWQGAAHLQPLGTPFPAAEAITHYARAMGAARGGNPVAASADIEKLQELRSGLEKAKQPYWAEQIEIQILSAKAWVAHAGGNRPEAQTYMRAAADLEDSTEKHVAMENRLYPMREQLGDMLREHGDPAAALKEYQVSMKNAPNRLRGFYGAAMAANGSGQKKLAAGYWAKLAELTKDADSERWEMVQVKHQLAAQ
jgi:tetratricopeptide (TPR) repeat protein